MKKMFCCIALCGILPFCVYAKKPVKVEKIKGGELYVCDYFDVSDATVTLKLSDFVNSLEVIKLDSDTSATVGNGPVCFSDNYMLIHAGYQAPVKLFDRKGKFLCDVGKVGRGPGEYMAVSDMQIDEKNKRLYIMPWQTAYLYEFDFEGKLVKPIRMAGGAPKAKFSIDGDRLTVVALPFKGLKWFTFQQTLKGELLDSVPVGNFAISGPNPYNNELFCNRANHSVYLFRSKGTQDTLYHYEPGKIGLIPKFTIDFGRIEVPLHECRELGDYFYFETTRTEPIDEHSFQYVPDKKVIINKKTLDANRMKFVNDLLGGYEISIWNCENGYFAENLDPVKLKDRLEKILKKGGLDAPMMKKITDLMDSIDENDNNYVICGKLK